MVLDTAAGELPPAMFHRIAAPDLATLAAAFPGRLGYYAKASHPAQLSDETWLAKWAVVGYDSRWDIASLLKAPRRTGLVQGNFDPALLFNDDAAFARSLDEFLAPVGALTPAERRGWICGLGHGILPGTPESNVKKFVETVRERFR